ncbi:MAG: hypothetical protein WAK86_19720 [Pseudonocardiaceae bacterium]
MPAPGVCSPTDWCQSASTSRRSGGTATRITRFSINYEALPQAIADLEAAAAFFDLRAEKALQLANISAPGTDGVSLYAVAQIGKWAADEGVNNLHATLQAGATQTRSLAQKLREDLKTYLNVEALNIPNANPGLPL